MPLTSIARPPSKDLLRSGLCHDIRNILNHIVGYGEMSGQIAEELGWKDLMQSLDEICAAARSILPMLKPSDPLDNDAHWREIGDRIVAESQRMNTLLPEFLARAREVNDPAFYADLERLNTATKNLAPLATQLGMTAPETSVDSAPAVPIEPVGTFQAPQETVVSSDPAKGLVLVADDSDDNRQFGMTAPETSVDSAPAAPIKAVDTFQAPQEAVVSRDPAKGLVLVADDSDDNRQLLTRYVEREGYSILSATNGKQALEMLRHHPFDVILLDMIMPEIDGFGVLTEMRTDPALRDIAVIMISAVDDIAKVAQCIEMGADDYLAKPFNSAILRARIRSLLERKRLRDAEKRRTEQLEKALAEIESQRLVAEKLLCNILPERVAEELREKGSVDPMYFEDVTILFTDFVGFTPSTEKLSAEDLVHLLNQYFTAFDNIMSSYGLEKLKTVGDSYMCAAGLPTRNPSHPVDAVMAAFEIVDYVARVAASGKGAGWQVRVGIHTGPVIAGVVGIRKFAFDIWGESVNLASRMESSGAPGRINLSERTYTRVKDFFACEHRGKVKTKEGREMDMYFVDDLSRDLLVDQSSSPPPKLLRRYKTYFQKELRCFPSCLIKQAS